MTSHYWCWDQDVVGIQNSGVEDQACGQEAGKESRTEKVLGEDSTLG